MAMQVVRPMGDDIRVVEAPGKRSRAWCVALDVFHPLWVDAMRYPMSSSAEVGFISIAVVRLDCKVDERKVIVFLGLHRRLRECIVYEVLPRGREHNVLGRLRVIRQHGVRFGSLLLNQSASPVSSHIGV